MNARELYAGAHLLDRQLLGRDGTRCGKVDDLELTLDPTSGRAYVSAVVSGPGALLTRTGHTRSGRWLRRLVRFADPGGADTGTIPLGRVAEIGDHLTLSLHAGQVAGHSRERWVQDHIISHIAGSRHRARQ